MATIITKNSSTASSVPAAGSLQQGELAVNVTDKKLYTKDSSAAVVKLVGSLGNQEANAVAITGGTINGTAIGGTTPAAAAFTTASASGGFTGNLTGNASTVTNGVYTTGSYADPAWITSLAGSKITGNISGNAANVTGTVAIANGGTGLTALGTGVQTALGQTVTGSGGIVLAASPSLTTPNLGTPSAVTLTNATGLPVSTGISGLGTNVATALGVSVGSVGSVVVNGGALGTPSSGTLTNATGLPLSTGVTGTLAVANGGTGITAFGSGVATALGVNVGSAGAFVVNGGALGTPSSGTVTNLTGTASININGTVGASTPNTGSFTTVTNSGGVRFTDGSVERARLQLSGTSLQLMAGSASVAGISIDSSNIATFTNNPILSAGTANGVAYLNGSKVLTTGSALTFDGTNLTVPAEVYRTSATSFVRLAGGDGAGSGANVLAFGQSHATAPGRLAFSATGTGEIQSSTVSGAHVWSINTEQMRLTSTGLGIGTSSPLAGAKLDVATTTQFAFDTTSTAGVRIGTQGTVGGSFMVQTASASAPYGSGLAIDGTYDGGTLQSKVNLKAFGVYSGGGYGSQLAFWTSNGTSLNQVGVFDSSGNLGLGVTPSAWGTYKAIQVGASTPAVIDGSGGFGFNYYFDGTNYRYIGSSSATIWSAASGQHRWYTAPSGTAGNTISFTQALTLTAAANLLLGGTSDPGGEKALYIANTSSVPGTPTGGGVLYVEGGALKYKGSSGTVTTLANA